MRMSISLFCLVQNEQGYRIFVKLISDAYMEGDDAQVFY